MTSSAHFIRTPATPTAVANRLRPLQPMTVRRGARPLASMFALALYARHAQATGLAPSLDLVHRHLPALHWSRAIHQHWQLGFAPQLRLQFAGDTWLASPPQSTDLSTPGTASPSPTIIVPTGTTLERLLLRNQRIDSLRTQERIIHAATPHAPAETPPLPAPAQTRAELRVERVYRDREVVARQVAPDAAVAVLDARAIDFTTVGRRDSAVPAATTRAPDVDIQRLADRVVNAIDRRLVAHRERLGRS